MISTSNLFIMLFLTHLIADWIFQGRWEGENKSKNIWALLHHSSVYTLFFVWTLYCFHQLRINLLVLLFVSHAIFDDRRLEHWIMRCKGFKEQTTEYWMLLIGIDQTLHIGILVLICVLLN
jgi:hypothetical protein